MRLEYTGAEEREMRIAEIEEILLNYEGEYSEEELDALEKELEKLTEASFGYEIVP